MSGLLDLWFEYLEREIQGIDIRLAGRPHGDTGSRAASIETVRGLGYRYRSLRVEAPLSA